jgi:hypothetical protein
MYSGSLDPVSNREHWIGSFEFKDATSGDPIDLSEVGVEVTFAIKPDKRSSPCLLATFENGKMVIPAATAGIAEWTFTSDELRTLKPGTYRAGVLLTRGGVDTQIFEGSVSVIDGVVP